MLGEPAIIENTMKCIWVRDMNYPAGDNSGLDVAITNVTVISQKGYDAEGNLVDTEEDIVTVKENEAGWVLQATGLGEAEIQLNYAALSDLAPTGQTITVTVTDEKYLLEYSYPNDSSSIFQGQTVTFDGFRLWRETLQTDETGEYLRDDEQFLLTALEDVTDSIDFTASVNWTDIDDEGNEYMAYDADLLDVEQGEDGRSLTITAREGVTGQTTISVRIMRSYKDEAGNVLAEDQIGAVDIPYFIIAPFASIDTDRVCLAPGESITADELHPVLKIYSKDAPDGEEISGATFLFRVDSDAEVEYGTISEDKTTYQAVSTLEEDLVSPDLTIVAYVEDGEYDYPVYRLYICNHQWEITGTTPSTCTTDGQKSLECTVCATEKTETIPATGHSYDTGKVTREATCTQTGIRTYTCADCGTTYTEEIPVVAHQWSAWTTVTEATVFAPAKQTRTCSVCKGTETQDYGTKLAATMTIPSSTLKMQVKQSTTKFAVTEMAAGDSLASVTSSNTKVLKVSKVKADGTFKLTAQKKAGTATLTITLASGKSSTVKVTVQKKTVKTTKLTVSATKLTIAKKAKVTLSPIVKPITSQQKVTYTSSNKKVATVNSNGVITAKKAGKAKITVKSGSKKVVVTVTVK
jgi:hypothetical protein